MYGPARRLTAKNSIFRPRQFGADGASVCVDVDECDTKPCWQARSQLLSYNILLYIWQDFVTAV